MGERMHNEEHKKGEEEYGLQRYRYQYQYSHSRLQKLQRGEQHAHEEAVNADLTKHSNETIELHTGMPKPANDHLTVSRLLFLNSTSRTNTEQKRRDKA